MESVAQSLENMRQSRIVIATPALESGQEFREEILKLCEKYKMTNVLLSHLGAADNHDFILQPYPKYKWAQVSLEIPGRIFYPPNWRNMHNKTLLTQPDDSLPNSLVFHDDHGQVQVSGFVANLVFFFAEYFNAHLQMYRPLEVDAPVHFTEITQMVKAELLDIPMTLDAGGRGNWWHITKFVLLNKVAIMVPLSSQLNVDEVFHLLLDRRFFAIIYTASLIFSTILSLIEWIFNKIPWNWNFLMSDEVYPGVLGQAFKERLNPIVGQRLIYFCIALIGLILSTEFSAKVNSYFTSAPYHRQLERLEDLAESPIKILLHPADALIMGQWLKKWHHIAVIAQNSTDFQVNRHNFNTSYGYVVQTPLWDIYDHRQKYFRRNVFHIPPAMDLHELMVWGIPLPRNSPYREALNAIIHLVHERGLMTAWIAFTYKHMVQLKLVPLKDPNTEELLEALDVEDLHWAWLLNVIGWFVSGGIFCMELLVERLKKMGKK
ncbi:uncharacterized protein LOC101900626 [Musca domestica]|uniref:Uncharacterized protein LOC101900626 n=1 Tax=Musca domestica TaxID=7370 RepID=A0A9J7D044_MUSDO|nr:uncharacterized protein LOC101900626 [Musca domestica]